VRFALEKSKRHSLWKHRANELETESDSPHAKLEGKIADDSIQDLDELQRKPLY
jgi:hypothetical protein